MTTETITRRTETRTRKGRGVGSVERAPRWVYGVLSLVILIGAFPLYWSFVIGSTVSGNATKQLPVLVPGGNFFDNVQRVFERVDIPGAALYSLIIAGTVTVSVLFFATLAGYAFAKLNFRGSNALFAFVMLTMALPPQLGVVGLYKMMSDWGWIGRDGHPMLAVIVPALVSAFGVFFMRNYLQGVIPTELLEAARVDGAGQFRTFLTVGVPAARPAMAILGLFTFVGTWTDLFWPMLVFQSAPKQNTMQTALVQLQASLGNNVDYSLVLTGALVSVVPLLILFFVAGKQLVAGIMAGAVKS